MVEGYEEVQGDTLRRDHQGQEVTEAQIADGDKDINPTKVEYWYNETLNKCIKKNYKNQSRRKQHLQFKKLGMIYIV